MSEKLPSDFLPANIELHELHDMHSAQDAEQFPTHLLPPVLGDIVKEVARVTKTPEAMAGPLVLGIVSASIGKGLSIRGHAGRITPSNIYVLLGAKSATGKSECSEIIFKPFIDYANAKHIEWIEEELPELQAEKDHLEAEIKKLRENKKNPETLRNAQRNLSRIKSSIQKSPRFYTDNVTGEKLAILISNQPTEALAVLSSDARDIVDILGGKYQQNKTDESIYLKAYSGDTCTIDRVSRPSTVIKSPQLTAVWAVQPDKISTLYNNKQFTDGGLMPRFLVVEAQCEPAIRVNMKPPDTGVLNKYESLIKSILLVLHGDENNVIQLPEDVMSVYTEYFNDIVKERQAGGRLEKVNAYAARWEENALRIGVCLHAAKHPENAMDESFSLQTAHEAIGLMKWFAEQQMQLLEGSIEQQKQELEERVLKLIEEKAGQCTKTDVTRKRITENSKSAQSLLQSMVNRGLLVEETLAAPGRGGHQQTIYKPI